MKNQESRIKNRTGFTLLETLIAIAILLIAIIGPLSIAANSLRSAYYARDQVTAYYLAEEGIEFIRYIRDANTLTGVTWDLGIASAGCTSNGPCGFDAFNNIFYNCPSSTSCPVQYDSNNKLYRQTNAILTPTNFHRFIVITPITINGGINEYKITTSVSWNTGNLNSPTIFSVSEDIFNWQQ